MPCAGLQKAWNIFRMRLLLACTTLCVLAPTDLLADTVFPPEPSVVSFAYAGKHPVLPMEGVTLAEMKLPDAGLEPPNWDDDGAAMQEPAVAYKVKGVPREFSRTELCSRAASAAEENDLPVPFFTNLIQQESGFKPQVVSRAGAQGIAQFMPKTASSFGLVNPFDPIHALAVSARFVSNLLRQFGNLGLAAAAYNAGPTRVSNWLAKRGKLPAETRNYVRSITGRPAEHWAASAVGANHRLPLKTQCTEAVVADEMFIASHPIPERPAKLMAAVKSPKLRGAIRLADVGKAASRPAAVVRRTMKASSITLVAESRTRKRSLAALKAEGKRLIIVQRETQSKSWSRSKGKAPALKRVKIAAAR